MTWEAATNQIADNVKDAVAETAIGFTGEIIRRWPVDTGFSRRAWKNDKVKYSPILWVGRRTDATGTMRGSLQLPLGGQPIFNRYQRLLEDKLRKVTQ